MYENKLEFPGGRGNAKQKNLPWGECMYEYFLKLHNVCRNQDALSTSNLAFQMGLTYFVNIKGIKCPRCIASDDGPRPVYR